MKTIAHPKPLSGAEASIIAYVARYPNAGRAQELMKRLGADAKRIAEALVDAKKVSHLGEAEKASYQAIRKWASR